jgi:glycogen phosphorylase
VQDYASGLYRPASQHYASLMAGGVGAVNAFAAWKQRVRERWGGVRLRQLTDLPRELPRAGTLEVRIAAALNGLAPADVRIEFVAQRVLPRTRVESPLLSSYRLIERRDDTWRSLLRDTGELDADGSHLFELTAAPQDSGQYAYEIRIYPWHELLIQPLELGLLKRL